MSSKTRTGTATTTQTATQTATPELRQWILEQARAGHHPEAVLKSMMASGWAEDVAIATLEDTLSGFLAEQGQAAAAAPQESPPSKVPEPALAGSPNALRVLDREVTVLMQMQNPRVVSFGNLLSGSECAGIIELAQGRLRRSETVDIATGGSEVNAARTSEGMFFSRGETPLISTIEARIAALLGWPIENGEGMQVLRYQPGAEYKPHYDYFDPAQPGTPTILKRGGQRVGTVVMYLNTPERGGGTTFPDVQLEVAPVQGNAVFFSYDRPHPSSRSLHGGAPVQAGEKWVATKWLREGRFD